MIYDDRTVTRSAKPVEGNALRDRKELFHVETGKHLDQWGSFMGESRLPTCTVTASREACTATHNSYAVIDRWSSAIAG